MGHFKGQQRRLQAGFSLFFSELLPDQPLHLHEVDLVMEGLKARLLKDVLANAAIDQSQGAWLRCWVPPPEQQHS